MAKPVTSQVERALIRLLLQSNGDYMIGAVGATVWTRPQANALSYGRATQSR